MFLKSNVSFFSFYFWEQKRIKKLTKKKCLKSKNTKETLVRGGVSFVFFCYMGLRHNNHVQDTTKKELFLKKKKCIQRKESTVQKMVYSPFSFLWGVRGCRSLPKLMMYSLKLAVEPLISHSLPFFFLSLSNSVSLTLLSVALSTCLTAISTSAFCNSKQNSS